MRNVIIDALNSANTVFWPYVVKTDKCWIFKKNLLGPPNNKRGHVVWYYSGTRKYIKASRFSYMLHNGYISSEISVLHRCDNLLCVNPSCLFIGSQQDNIADMIAKKRHSFGEQHNPKLNWEKVRKIRRLYATGCWTHRELGEKYNVSHSVIRNIIINKKWKIENDPNNKEIHIEDSGSNIPNVQEETIL